jgi:4-hydroxy-tetrahydrodipicolinate synthase
MTNSDRPFSGIWLPIITPFQDGHVDEKSFLSLLQHYSDSPIDGYIIGATTGEGLTLSKAEISKLIYLANSVLKSAEDGPSVFLGLSGSHTQALVDAVQRWNDVDLDGYLVTCPYYVRPSQEGIGLHFRTIAAATTRPIMIYNIPYRTGVNMTNDCLLELVQLDNVLLLKDCCADLIQSSEFIQRKPSRFSVLTGEDKQFLEALEAGADGGVLMSAHVQAKQFAEVLHQIQLGNSSNARSRWQAIRGIPELLFAEPSPAPVKYWLWRKGMVASPEVCLPMTEIGNELARKIDQAIAMGY